MTSIIEAHALSATVEARIAALWELRRLEQRQHRVSWTQARHDRDTELRALVRLCRSARRLARRTVERQDPITMAQAQADPAYEGRLDYHDWQAAYEPENREGDPAFNGAFTRW